MGKKQKEENTLKQFDLVIDYEVKFTSDKNVDGTPLDKNLEYAKLTQSYIVYAVTAHHKEGLNSQFRRLYAVIEQKMENSITDKSYIVSLTQSELNFIKDAFASDKTKFMPQLAKYIIKLEDALALV